MYLWKIEPFDIPSTDRTQPSRQAVAIQIGFWDGLVPVLDTGYSPLTLVIDYFDNEGRKREFLQDRIEVKTIRDKATTLGLEGEEFEGFVKTSMDAIVKHLIGGNTLSERRDALAQLALMFGQVVLPVEEQTGTV